MTAARLLPLPLLAALLLGRVPGAHAQDAGAAPVAEGVIGEAPIVAGNLAAAKDRALNEAFRQLVERAVATALEEAGWKTGDPLPPALVSARAGWLQKPRRLVSRHNVLEQGAAGGNYRVRVTAVINEAQLRREIERARGAAAQVPPAGGVPVVVSGPAEAGTAVLGALAAAGVPAFLQKSASGELAALQALAGRAGARTALLVSGRAASEGLVRGTDRRALECHLGVRVVPAPPRDPPPERGAMARGFDKTDDDARAACFTRAAGQVVAASLPDLGRIAAGGTRAVTVDLDLAEPAALSLVLGAFRRLGGGSRVELRRVIVGHVELAVTTRLAPAALLAQLERALAPRATIVPRNGLPADGGGHLALTVRLAAPAVAPVEGAPGPVVGPPDPYQGGGVPAPVAPQGGTP